MRKSFGLAVVGFALTFGIGSRFASQARVNQSLPVTSTFAKQQFLANHNRLLVTAFPTDKVSVHNNTVDKSPLLYSARNGPSLLRNNRSTDGLYSQTIRQEIPETAEVEHFRRVMQDARTHQMYDRPMGEIMQAIAKSFLGTTYQAGLLDQSQEETLVVTLNKFDCVLFVETVKSDRTGCSSTRLFRSDLRQSHS